MELVQPVKGMPAQLLDLIAENKAQHDMFVFVEGKFANDEISLETFMKLSRKIEEEKFMSKYLIKKAVEALKNEH